MPFSGLWLTRFVSNRLNGGFRRSRFDLRRFFRVNGFRDRHFGVIRFIMVWRGVSSLSMSFGHHRLIAGEHRGHCFFVLRPGFMLRLGGNSDRLFMRRFGGRSFRHYLFYFVVRFRLCNMTLGQRRQTACAGVAGAGQRFI